MGSISRDLIREIRNRKTDSVLNLQEIVSRKKEISKLNAELATKFKIGISDPSLQIYVLLQNLLSYFSEEISVNDEFIDFYDTIVRETEEFMPSYPPISPITN